MIAHLHQNIFQLRDGVNLVNRAGLQSLLVGSNGEAVRVSPIAADLMPLLTKGSSLQELVSELQTRHPGAYSVEEKLSAFLEVLRRAGLLRDGGSGASQRNGRYSLLNIDPLALAIIQAMRIVPTGVIYFVLCVLAGCSLWSVCSLFYSGCRLRPEMVLWLFDPGGILLLVLLAVPTHEFAHALACRAVGVPVSAAGVILFARFWPVPFVDTSCAYNLQSRLPRMAIAAAGPFVDLLTCGVGAWFLLPGHPQFAFAHAGRALFLMGLFLLFFDTTPLTPSDGSHVVEAFLNDELARRDALRLNAKHPRRSLPKYRIACVAHMLLALLVFWLVI